MKSENEWATWNLNYILHTDALWWQYGQIWTWSHKNLEIWHNTNWNTFNLFMWTKSLKSNWHPFLTNSLYVLQYQYIM